MQPGRSSLHFPIVVVLMHAIFFGLALHYGNICNGDSFEYVYEALNIRDRLFFYCGNPALPVEMEYLTLRTPGYPLFLLLIYCFTQQAWAVLLLQNFISIFNILYLRKILLRIGYHKTHDWLLLLFIVAYPVQFIYANTIAPDILLQTCVLIYFRHAIELFQTKNTRQVLWMSLSLIAGLMIKPVLYPFAFIHLAALVIYFLFQKKNRLRASLYAALPVLVIFLYNFWNYIRTDQFHFTSTQSFNAIFYLHKYFSAKEGPDKGIEFLNREREMMNELPRFRDRYDYANKRGRELLEREFIPYTIFHVTQSAKFFVDPGKGELDMFMGKLTLSHLYSKHTKGLKEHFAEEGWKGIFSYASGNTIFILALIILLFNLIKLTGLFLFLISKKTSPHLRWFLLLFLAYFALITGPITAAHYVLPVSLIIAGCSILGFTADPSRS